MLTYKTVLMCNYVFQTVTKCKEAIDNYLLLQKPPKRCLHRHSHKKDQSNHNLFFVNAKRIRTSYLRKYWHMGNSKKANATVAITAVQIANRICIESKKKNIIIKLMLAPRGKHIA